MAQTMARIQVSSLVSLLLYMAQTMGQSDPTVGFTKLPLSTSNFEIHKPYNLQEGQRYSFTNGVHKLWVLSTDKPFMPTSPTRPRTEIRIKGYDYSSGVWQFEGYCFVPSDTSGVSIMQIFGGNPQATTIMLRVYTGSLWYYKSTVLIPNIYDKWFRLNVVHDVDGSRVRVFIDSVLKLEVDGRGGDSHYFKFGVYEQNDPSNYMESRWRDIKVFRKV